MSKALFEKAYRESRAADAPVFVDDALVLKADGDYFHVLTQRLYAAFEWGLAAKREEPEPEITAASVRALRERTGEGLVSCRRALIAHKGDAEGALEHLRCEGQAVVRRPGSLQPCGCPVR